MYIFIFYVALHYLDMSIYENHINLKEAHVMLLQQSAGWICIFASGPNRLNLKLYLALEVA